MPNARVRRRLLQIQADTERAQARGAWRRAPVVTLDAWFRDGFEQLIDAGHETRTLLNASQATLLWERAVLASDHAGALLRPRETAVRAMRSARLAADWQVRRRVLEAHRAIPETGAFLHWRERVVADLAESGWMTADHLPRRLEDALATGLLAAPPALVIVPPVAPTPMLATLVRTLEASGTHVQRVAEQPVATDRRVATVADPETELALAAAWCADRLDGNPDLRIALVCADLAQRGEAVATTLHEYLHPNHRLGDAGTPLRYALPRQLPLADSGTGSTALAALRLATRSLDVHDASALLRSRWLPGASAERGPRALLDARLRAAGRRQVRLADVARHLRPDHPRRIEAPQLAGVLEALGALAAEAGRRRGLSDWALAFSRTLRAIGWPGDTPSSEMESVARQRFVELLPEFGQLGPLAGPMNGGSAASRLARLAAEARLDVTTAAGASVSVLAPDDAAVAGFDALWLLGADDDSWPPRANPDPFLPTAVQRDLGMPGATHAITLGAARRRVARLQRAAPVLRVSHARTHGDVERRRSPLFADFGAARWFDAPAAPAPMRDPPPLESVDDHRGPPVDADDPARGGTALLGDQSDCPFRAFARHRLGLAALEEPEEGIDPRVRGTLVHDALEAFWQATGSSSALATLTPQARSDAVAAAVDHALTTLARRDREAAGSRLAEVERIRLVRLVEAWLDEESRRVEPFSVEELEDERIVSVGGVRLRIRADRIDRLADGRLVIIDYKTGRQVSIAGWDEERLSDPQVPLYAVSSQRAVAAAALAQVSPGKCGFRAVTDEDGIVPVTRRKTAEPLADRLARWRDALDALGHEVAEGLATVTPRGTGVCRYCDFHAACHIAEHDVVDDEDDLAANGSEGSR